jgi:hypothetical protein
VAEEIPAKTAAVGDDPAKEIGGIKGEQGIG